MTADDLYQTVLGDPDDLDARLVLADCLDESAEWGATAHLPMTAYLRTPPADRDCAHSTRWLNLHRKRNPGHAIKFTHEEAEEIALVFDYATLVFRRPLEDRDVLQREPDDARVNRHPFLTLPCLCDKTAREVYSFDPNTPVRDPLHLVRAESYAYLARGKKRRLRLGTCGKCGKGFVLWGSPLNPE